MDVVFKFIRLTLRLVCFVYPAIILCELTCQWIKFLDNRGNHLATFSYMFYLSYLIIFFSLYEFCLGRERAR